MLSGSTVLLTGGSGSVGRGLLPRLLEKSPRTVRVFDNNESGLARLSANNEDDRLRYLAGDIRDRDRLDRAMEDVDVVVHTAAMKHVDICEYNPFEAVQTNAVGLQNVVDAAIDANVDRIVFTSSDKAVNPANTMGTTKLLGEKLITAGNKHAGDRDVRFASVRFGNVINSSQSVIPLFREQIQNGGPVALTDPRMTRFFLTYDDVAHLVTSAIEKMAGGEIFIHKMPAVKIEDLAYALTDVLAPDFGYEPSDIDIDVVGRRLGETFHEEIMTERETTRAVENESLYAILPETTDGDGYLEHDGLEGFSPASSVGRSTEEVDALSKTEVTTLLRENDVLEGAT